MPTEVKICGLSDEEGVDAALHAGADLVGFVFFPPSPRNVALSRAAALAERARGRARIVALTVDADDGLLGAIAETLRPDLLQLHGRESPGRLAAIRALTGIGLMKVVSVGERADLAAAALYDSADRLLFDTRALPGASRPGGHGRAFDWSVMNGFSCGKAWLLAGGLNAQNVAEALAVTGAPGVDVSSGVESAPGRKDPALIHAFVTAVRAAEEPRRKAG